jgi:hypothetical protein
MRDDGSVEIRSFRNCFKLERRIHKIDRWRIPLPFGVPLRSLGYAIAAELVILSVSQLPLIAAVAMSMPAPVRLGVLPVTAAYALTRCEIDGRPAHAFIRSWVLLGLRPTRLVAWRRAAPPGPVALGGVTLAADERGARLRPAVIRGPVRVLLRYPVRARERRSTLYITADGARPLWRGREIGVGPGRQVVIR